LAFCIDFLFIAKPIWLEDAKNVTQEQHEEFYKFMGHFDKPRYVFQYKTDAPLNIRALFYVPQFKPCNHLIWNFFKKFNLLLFTI